MRRTARLSEMRKRLATRDLKGAEFLLHAGGTAEGARHQRAQRERTQDAWRVQGLTRSRLRLLFDQTVAACQENQKRRQELSDCAAMDDQPLMHDPLRSSNPN
jgi:hypothetical protein